VKRVNPQDHHRRAIKAVDDGRGGRFDSKLYFLSSGHVPGVQDIRIPRVFKDSPSFDGVKIGRTGGGEGGGLKKKQGRQGGS